MHGLMNGWMDEDRGMDGWIKRERERRGGEGRRGRGGEEEEMGWMDGIVTVFDRKGAGRALVLKLDVNGRWRRAAPEVDRCPLTSFLLQFVNN